jgi:hypothetical protein
MHRVREWNQAGPYAKSLMGLTFGGAFGLLLLALLVDLPQMIQFVMTAKTEGLQVFASQVVFIV